jgi:SAM-dependent methyltransferase
MGEGGRVRRRAALVDNARRGFTYARRRFAYGPASSIERHWSRLVRPHLTPVERYWNSWTVNSIPFKTAVDSADYLEWRVREYPLYRELMGLWGNHNEEIILDYGCGPGDDVTGYLLYSGCRQVIGADISAKALKLTASRLELHGVEPDRYRLVPLSDADPRMPLPDQSVDYVHCGGVIHHTTAPERVFEELARTLRTGGRGRIMVYNRDSLWFHLYTAYEQRILNGQFLDLTADEAFARNTDGRHCPISRAFRPEAFCALARGAGFDIEFLGGYFHQRELELWRRLGPAATNDPRLPEEHRDFLAQLAPDADGFPRFGEHYAGVGGVYAITKAASPADTAVT